MRFVYFTHSLVSCWNHGNAHFLRGLVRELQRAGEEVRVLEPADGWSRANLIADGGSAALDSFARAFPDHPVATYDGLPDLDEALDGADVVIVHEWTAPEIVAAVGRYRASGGRFTLLFHDTPHRAVSDPAAMQALDLSGYDGVLAFGETLAEVYRRWGWGERVFVWHEAADVALFHPPHDPEPERQGLVWIGNWGDGERTAELESYLLRPAATVGLPLDVHGVRYPPEAVATLQRYGARYHGWLPNAEVPETFARHMATVHVPRRFYARTLPGVPTIRVFEALACGIPLVSAPWDDSEGLFREGDFLRARTPQEMEAHLRALSSDADLRQALSQNGRDTVTSRHTCAHRVEELMAILAFIERRQQRGAA